MDILGSSLGGVIIGASAGSLWLLQGRIAGISGITGRLVKGCVGATATRTDIYWRSCFVIGLLLGGLALHQVHRPAFPHSGGFFSSSSNTDNTAVLLPAGLLVGYGTQLGNGCTSGHGVCGLARGSVRSLVATITFMLAGSLTAAISRALVQFDGLASVGTSDFWCAAFSGSINTIAPITNSSFSDVEGPLTLAAAAFLALALLSAFATRLLRNEWLANGLAALPGFSFGIGLGLSGMTDPVKVLAFLDPFGRQWDPSLMFVMGGALAVNTAIYAISRRRSRPVLSQCIIGCKFDAPLSTQITAELIVGAALFGTGWGLAGRCPGPALLRATEAFFNVQQALPSLIFLAAMLAGFVLHHFAPISFAKPKRA